MINVTPTISQFLSSARSFPGEALKEEWVTDTYTTFSDNAHTPAEDYTYAVGTTKTRASNYHQYLQTTFKVGRHLEKVKKVGSMSEFAYQAEKALTEHPTDIERALIYNDVITGDEASAAKLKGYDKWVTTNVTTLSDVNAFTEDSFNDLTEDIVTTTTGRPDIVRAAPKLKRIMSSWTTPNQRYIDASNKVLVGYASIYEGEYGIFQFSYHTYLGSSFDINTPKNHRAFILTQEKWQNLVLYPTEMENTPSLGFWRGGAINTVMTLRCLSESCNGKFVVSS